MTDEEIVTRLRGGGLISIPALVAADRIEEMVKEKRELVLQSLADSGQAQEAYAEVVRLKEGIQKAVALAKKPYYGYLEDRIDNYYEGFLILEELLKE